MDIFYYGASVSSNADVAERDVDISHDGANVSSNAEDAEW